MREDLNTPPALYAVDNGSGRERMILDLNPQLADELQLGHVELIQWTSPDGHVWGGRLYYPVGYSPGRRYPLVIQTHGYSKTVFSLIGDDSFPSVFCAQALASRNIAVLQIGNPDPAARSSGGDWWSSTPAEGKTYMAGFESAVEHLSKTGLVDRSKAGIVGFSRTGFHVEYAVAHSDFPFAVALAADNIDNGYMQALVKPDWGSEFARTNGDKPFAEGLQGWLEEAPAFNAQRVYTPLRLQINSGGMPFALTHWEMFSRLSSLQRPVEFYIIPNIEQGTHNLQNPGQLLASAGGAVDWFDFWLNGHEDSASAKAEQYERWRKLRQLRDETLKTPRPPRLDWSVQPVSQSNSVDPQMQK